MCSSPTLSVIKRDRSIVSFESDKIAVAMTKAFVAVEGAENADNIHERVYQILPSIIETLTTRYSGVGAVNIEIVQDQTELELMRAKEYKVARAFVLYRENRNKERLQNEAQDASLSETICRIKTQEGDYYSLTHAMLQVDLKKATEGLDLINTQLIADEVVKNVFDGMTSDQLNTALMMSSRPMVEKEPSYSYFTARLLLVNIKDKVMDFFKYDASQPKEQLYPSLFKSAILHGTKSGFLNPAMASFDLDRLSQALIPEQDFKFQFLGLQTLYDRYLLQDNHVRFELPQGFFMRVAMGLSLNEAQKDEQAIKFYRLLSSFDFMSSTPTLFNSGSQHSQLSSCYLTTIPDDLDGIFLSMRDNALLSKWAGGLGNDWTPVRALSSHIKGTNGESQGIVPFLKVFNDTAIAVNQGGKRKGAVCAYLETWHLDIESFLELRKNTGDERRRTHDMNSANWIPDLFMERVLKNETWTLFSPNNTPDLHDLYGQAFRERYEAYEAMALEGKIKPFKQVLAADLWKKMLSMLFETGHPWIAFKDPCNIRSPQQHQGVVHSSNLCTEITLNTSATEVAVCNLGSINLAAHIDPATKTINRDKLKQTIQIAIRLLDNVIDLNFYPIEQAKNSNLKHRPIGLGLMGFHDALYLLNIPYVSEAAVEFADQSMELISYYAIEASSDLAKERGAYSSYPGSLWDKNILPIDSIDLLKQSREKQYLEVNDQVSLDWQPLREKIKAQGMRNSNVMAIAPTATISNIVGVSQSIEPTYQNLFVKSNLSGEFTFINQHLVCDLKALDIWDEAMINDLKYYNGSVATIHRIPDQLKTKYKTAFEIDPKWLIEAASRRQKWIDQAQSLNIYIAKPKGKQLDLIYKMAWYRGLKTTYYLRSLGATSVEKSTIQDFSLNKIQRETNTQDAAQALACSIDNPDCESCQ